MKIWEPKLPGTLWATPGLLRDSYLILYCHLRLGLPSGLSQVCPPEFCMYLPVPHTCHMTRPPNSSYFDLADNIWSAVQIMQLFTALFPPARVSLASRTIHFTSKWVAKPNNIAVQRIYTLAVLLRFSKGADRYSATPSFVVVPSWFDITLKKIWSDSDRASSLICGNKIPTRCNRWYLLQILLLAQHVSGTIMPIIRSSRVFYIWSLPVVFGALVFKLSVWCRAEGYVSGLRTAARKLDTQPSAPHHTDNLKTKAPNTTGSNHLYNTIELLIMGIMVTETCCASDKICIKTSVASNLYFISTYKWTYIVLP